MLTVQFLLFLVTQTSKAMSRPPRRSIEQEHVMMKSAFCAVLLLTISVWTRPVCSSEPLTRELLKSLPVASKRGLVPVTAVELTVVTGQVEISGNVLRFGNSTTPGWQSSVVFPPNFPHSYQFRQTVNSVHIHVTMNGGSAKSFVSNAVAIDGLLGLPGQSPSHYYNLGYDTPSIALRSTWRAITVSENFSLYDYFRPGYADFATTNPGIGNLDAIFVPIRVADWQWCAEATSTDGLLWNLASHGGVENTTLHFDVERDSPIYDYHILYLVPTEIIGGEYFFDDDIFMN